MTVPYVTLIDMPPAVKAFIRGNPDGTATIVLNSRLSVEAQRESYLHELQHLFRGDLSREDPADEIESENH